MLKRSVFLLAALAVSHPAYADDDDPPEVQPLPGRDKVQPMAPTWCPADFKALDHDKNRAKRTVSTTATSIRNTVLYFDRMMGSYLDIIARTACEYPKEVWVQKQVAAWRQRWINATGLSEREDREHLRLFVRGKPAWEEINAFCKAREAARVDGAFGGSYAALMEIEGICGKTSFTANQSSAPSWQHAFWMDNPTRPISMMERLGYINRCISAVWPEESSMDVATRGDAMQGYAYCKSDARELDLGTLEAELAKLQASPTVIARYTQLFSWVQQNVKRATAEVHKHVAGAPKLKPWFVDNYDVGFAEWKKLYAENKADIDAAFEIQNKLDKVQAITLRDQGQTIGCTAVRQAWVGYVTKRKPKNVGDVVTAAHSNIGYLLASHLALCEAVEGRGVEARALLSLLAAAPKMYSGPRVHAAAYIFDGSRRANLADLSTSFFEKLDESGTQIVRKAAWFAERTSGEISNVIDKGGTGGSALADANKAGDMYKGRIAKVKKTADGLHVVFKKEAWQEPQYSCVNDGINQWTSDGTPVYYKKCKFLGMDKKEFTQDPITFVGTTAVDLKPGQLLKFARFQMPGKSETFGYVVEKLAPGAGKAEPKTISYLGIPMQ